MLRRTVACFAAGTVALTTLTVAGTPTPIASAAPRPAVLPSVSCPPPEPASSTPVDVVASGFRPIAPLRLADTRSGPGVAAPVGAGCVLRVDLSEHAPANATAVALTVTSDRAPRPTFVTAFACGSPRPDVSMLNPRPNGPTPNATVVALDSTDAVCVYADDVTDLIVDVTGWFAPDGDPYHEITPERALDTRTGPRPTSLPPGKPAAQSVVAIAIGGAIVPPTAVAVTATVTVTQAEGDVYVTAFPCGADVPATSTNNTEPGFDRAAPAVVGLAGDGTLCVYTDVAAHLIVDVTGWFGPNQPFNGTPLILPPSPLDVLQPVRLADSRNGIGGWTTPFAADEERHLDVLTAAELGTTSAHLNVTAAEAVSAGHLTVYPCGQARPTASSVNYTPGLTETAGVTVGLGDAGDVCVYASQPTHVIVDLVATTGDGGGPLLRAAGSDPGLDRVADPRQPDLTLHCPAGGGQVTLAAQAVPGATVAIGGTSAGARATVTRGFAPHELVRVRATAGATVEEHWVRCLPNDFPILAASGASPTPGWYRASNGSGATYAFILDEFGVPVWYQRTPYPVISMWDGINGADIAWRRWTGGGFPVEADPLGYELRDLDGTYVGAVEIAGEAIDWHELLHLDNGNVIVVTYPERTIGQTRNCIGFDGVARTTNLVVDSDIVELEPDGDEVWRWSSEDHTVLDETLLPVCFDVDPDDTGEQWALDLVHVNAVDEADGGDLIVTARHLDAVLHIDKATGAVEWKLGGTQRGDGKTLAIAGDPLGGPRAPHDGRTLPGGHITLHDNRTAAPPNQRQPRALEYAIDPTAMTATLVWSYTSAINPGSSSLGSVRRQPDGNTVIGWGDAVGPWLEEVDPAKNTVLAISTTLPGLLAYRADKVPASTYDRDDLRALAGRTADPAP